MNRLMEDLKLNLLTYYDSIVDLIPKVLIAILVMVLFYFIARVMKRIIMRLIDTKAQSPLTIKFIAQGVFFICILIGTTICLGVLGLGDIATKLLTGAGISAFVIGFAFKDIGENFLSGILLAFNRPFRIGDLVEIQGNLGRVSELELRTTLIRSLTGKDIFIPNSAIIKNPIINYTLDGYFRESFIIGIGYEDDLQKAIKLIMELCNENSNQSNTEHQPSISILDFASNTINLEVKFWVYTQSPEAALPSMRSHIMNAVIHKLQSEGFILPGNILEIKNYNRSPLGIKNSEQRIASN